MTHRDEREAARDDPYARSEYRRLIAWGPRIQRESPWLLRLLHGVDASVLDLGSGTGEHVAFFGERGLRSVGVDRSESMIRRAREHEAAGHGRFLLGDVTDLGRVLGDESPFGLVLGLGNMLPHLLEDAELCGLLRGVARYLAPQGHWVLQLLNYRRIVSQGLRTLPVNVMPGDGAEELVFLRMMKPISATRLLFIPATLCLDPDAEVPLKVHQARTVTVRPWDAEELVRLIEGQGFRVSLYGDFQEAPFDPDTSHDLILVARPDEDCRGNTPSLDSRKDAQ